MSRIGIELKFKHGGESWRLIDIDEAPIILEEWLDESKYISVNDDVIEKDKLQTIAFRNKLID